VVSVSPAGAGDAEAIAGLLEEMDGFYGAESSDPLELRVRQIREALFGDLPAGFALLAWDEGQLAGLAAYSFIWPAVGLTRSLDLKELYVPASHRQRGVGKLLIQAIFAEAGQRGCSRVEWTTDTDNTGAQDFYRQLGFPVHPTKIFYRAEGTDDGMPPAG
jgi:GNAT superfamily N-acetyltransferase